MAIPNFARNIYAADQNTAGLIGPAAIGQRLPFLKVRGHVFGVPVDHRLELGQPSFHISL